MNTNELITKDKILEELYVNDTFYTREDVFHLKDSNIVHRGRVFGLYDSVRSSKYPYSVDTNKCTEEITERTNSLASAPIGSGHDNFLNGIIVQFDLTFTNKAWVEAERYHFFDFKSSQSTMHKITDFDLDDAYVDYVDKRIVDVVKEKVEEYKSNPSSENYLKILYNNPAGFRLTARMTTNYRQLKTIYNQRKSHRLPEWVEFCEWMSDALPYWKDWVAVENKS